MAEQAIEPIGVALQTTETTVCTALSTGPSTGWIRFVNATAIAQTLNTWVYKSGVGSAADSTRLLPKDFPLPVRTSVKVPFVLAALYKVTATAGANNGITATPFGLETA